MSTDVVAWRIWGLAQNAVLFAPFAPTFWPDAHRNLTMWPKTTTTAGCVVKNHPAPAEDCTCGIRGTQDLQALLDAATARPIPSREPGVVGKVKLSGRMLPGIDIPNDDPPTTVRAERAEIVELHLAPAHSGLAGRVATHYGVPVYRYDETTWADRVPGWDKVGSGQRVKPAGEDEFYADVRRAGFGTKDLDSPGAKGGILSLGKTVCRALRSGVSLNDVLGGLFDTDSEPTFRQVEVLQKSAVENLCPECEYAFVPDKRRYAEPIRASENARREARQAAMEGRRYDPIGPAGSGLQNPFTAYADIAAKALGLRPKR